MTSPGDSAYEYYKQAGICCLCGVNAAYPGTVRCKQCTQRQRSQRTAKRQERARLGLCGTCGKQPTYFNHHRCYKCLDQSAGYRKKRVADRPPEVCYRCKRTIEVDIVEKGGSHCQSCLDERIYHLNRRRKKRQKRKDANEFCHRCNKRLSPARIARGVHTCDACVYYTYKNRKNKRDASRE